MTTVISNTLVKANPKVRKFVLIFTGSAIAFGGLSVFFSQQLTKSLDENGFTVSSGLLLNISHTLIVIAAVFGISLILFSGWIGAIGVQSLREGCYPPTKSILICDTLQVTGLRATLKAIAAILLAIASALGALGIGLEICGFLTL